MKFYPKILPCLLFLGGGVVPSSSFLLQVRLVDFLILKNNIILSIEVTLQGLFNSPLICSFFLLMFNASGLFDFGVVERTSWIDCEIVFSSLSTFLPNLFADDN